MATFAWYGMLGGDIGRVLASGSGIAFLGPSIARTAVGSWNGRTYTSSVSGSLGYQMLNTQSGSTVLPVSDSLVPLSIIFTNTSSVAISIATLKAFAPGEVNPPLKLRILAAEASGSETGAYVNGSTTWQELSGSLEGYSLSLAPRLTGSLNHTFRVAVTTSPTDAGKIIGNVLQMVVEYY